MHEAGQADCYVAGAQRSELSPFSLVSGSSWVGRMERTHARFLLFSHVCKCVCTRVVQDVHSDQSFLVNECQNLMRNSLLAVFS